MGKVRLVFESPPDSISDEYPAFAAALRDRPEEWAVLTEDAPSSLVTRINTGMVSAFTGSGRFQATGRTVATEPRRRFKIWVRFIPTPDSEDVT